VVLERVGLFEDVPEQGLPRRTTPFIKRHRYSLTSHSISRSEWI
jgi:hypothetical protein